MLTGVKHFWNDFKTEISRLMVALKMMELKKKCFCFIYDSHYVIHAMPEHV